MDATNLYSHNPLKLLSYQSKLRNKQTFRRVIIPKVFFFSFNEGPMLRFNSNLHKSALAMYITVILSQSDLSELYCFL